MKKLKYFSGIKPTLEDLEFDQEGKENAILDRQKEMFSSGVVMGLQLIEQNGVFTLQPGVGYTVGERIEVNESVKVAITVSDQPKYVVLTHRHALSNPVAHFVTGEMHEIYQADSFSVEVRDTLTLSLGELLIAEVSNAGIVDRRSFIRLAVDDRLHAPNGDIGTTAPEFLVGIGDPAHPQGLRVLTESPVPKPPLNLRINAIRPDFRNDIGPRAQDAVMSINAGRSSGFAQVQFAWEYRDIVGETVASDAFRIDNSGYQFAVDKLKGYFITFASGEEFLITGNQATTGGHTLVTVLGDLQGLSASVHPAVIHPGATEYRFMAIPVDVNEDTQVVTNPNLPAPPLASLPVAVEERIEGFTWHQASPVASSCTLRLPLGRHYLFQVQAVRYEAVSLPAVMGAGSFSWRGNQIEYSCPFLVVLPSLREASLNLSSLPNGTGFTAAIDGWEEADLLEYGWVRLGSDQEVNIDFDDSDHHPGVTAQRSIRVLVTDDVLEQVSSPVYAARLLSLDSGIDTATRLQPQRRRYKFAVRPLIGGQVVGEILTGRIILESDPYIGQAPVVSVIQALTRNLDLLNKTVRNLDAIRQAQSARVEDQLMTLNTAVQAGQEYAHFSVAEINLPFPEVQDEIPLLGRDSPEGYLMFELDPELTEQVFAHGLGHLNYIVQVRDADGVIVDADVDLNDDDVVIRLAEPMAGTVIIIDGQQVG